MMKRISLVFMSLMICGALSSFKSVDNLVEAPTWEVDKTHSSISFKIRHFVSHVVASFDDYEGTIKFDPEDLESSSVNFSVKVASVNTKNERRDEHLQSDDFFSAEKFPDMNFKSSSITKDGDGYVMNGTMTIRDVSKEVQIPFTFLGEMKHPRNEAMIGGFSSEFTIDRTEYGVGSGNFAATTTLGAEVEVSINFEVSRPTT